MSLPQDSITVVYQGTDARGMHFLIEPEGFPILGCTVTIRFETFDGEVSSPVKMNIAIIANHPCQSETPSTRDRELTEQLTETLAIFVSEAKGIEEQSGSCEEATTNLRRRFSTHPLLQTTE